MATCNSTTGFKKTLIIAIFAGTGALFGGEELNKTFAARAEAELHRTQAEFQSSTNISGTAWEFARACFDFADFATNATERAAVARQGIAACRRLITLEPESAPAHYYLAMNLGQLSRGETLGALRNVREMEHEFKTAAELDGHFDFAGPERGLGLLYREAPGWPVSIGNRRKARQWLELAVDLAPDYPENRLNLIESYLQWHDPTDASRELKALEALWPSARTNFTDAAWKRNWDDWTARKNAGEQASTQTFRPVEPPKNRH